MNHIALDGLRVAPSQTWRAVRLVPLLRDEPIADLRLASIPRGDAFEVVQSTPRTGYASYVPHALLARWSTDGTPVASFGTRMIADGQRLDIGGATLRLSHRMAKRVDKQALRFLPLHVAMEGFLSLHVGGPAIEWAEYSRQALSRGLSPRIETSVRGAWIAGLAEALATFELHDRQVGVLVFVADALASAFVVPHPDDYRRLHRTLVEDFFGELLYTYGLLYHSSVTGVATPIDESRVASLDDLHRELDRMRREWADFHTISAAGLFDRPVQPSVVYRLGRFALDRFLPSLDPDDENHIGERILTDTGELAYLETFRLSAAQVRRAYLLQQLARADWKLDDAAAALGQSRDALIARLDRAGFGYLLRKHLLPRR